MDRAAQIAEEPRASDRCRSTDPAWTRWCGWFHTRGWTPSAAQQALWRADRAGESGLLHAPTGTGKTLAAFGGTVLRALAGRVRAAPHLLWITPLRALATDTTLHLSETAAALGLGLEIERRTGDVDARTRARQRRRLPEVLITTPESLALLISHAEQQQRLSALAVVVVDEWHELLGSKRGVLLELCLARLRALAPGLRIWGMSASLGDPEHAMRVLLGPRQRGRLICDRSERRWQIEALLPADIDALPWGGHLGLHLLAAVRSQILAHERVLLYTQTRSQAELWYQALAAVWPDGERGLGLHHGSLSRTEREAVERGLRTGEVRCVVATSSLDLGIDLPAVDLCIQIGSPKGVARLLQRAGRSGHQPGGIAKLLVVPTHALELLDVAAAREALAEGALESRTGLEAPLDVLIQHLATLAVGGGFEADATFDEVRTTHAYQALDRATFERALRVLERGGECLQRYPNFQRLRLHQGRYRIEAPKLVRLHRANIGAITSDGQITVRFRRGAELGQIEESFLARLAPGTPFHFAGRTVVLQHLEGSTAYVRRAGKGETGRVPRWMGGKMPLSTQLADYVRRVLERGSMQPEYRALQPILELQRLLSAIPRRNELLIEAIDTRDGHNLFFYPFAGRLAHEALAAVLAHRLARLEPNSFSFACNDYGLVLLGRKPVDPTPDRLRAILSARALATDLRAAVMHAELAERAFRPIAEIAGLCVSGLPGRRRSARQLQTSATLLYRVLREFDPGHLLLQQVEREVLEDQFDWRRLEHCLTSLATQRLRITRPPRLTPFAFPLWAEGLRAHLSTETWQERVRAMQASVRA